jgi:Ca-activated chloride channel family protein
VGSDWNESLLKGLADTGRGNWHYIESAASAQEVFDREFSQLASTAFANVQLQVRCTKDVVVKNARQVVPECAELPFQPLGEREFAVQLHTMQNNAPKVLVADLGLPKRADGQYVVATLECTYDVPAENVTGESTGPVEVRVTYTSDPSESYINGQVAKYIDELQTDKLADGIQDALKHGDTRKATQLAQRLQKTATRLGAAGAKKTQLANQVLSEIEGGGTVSRKTQLALQDGARKTQLAD